MRDTPTLAAAAAPRTPILAGLLCYVLWGLLPVLFHAAAHAGAAALEIVAWRTVFAVPFAAALVLATGELAALRRLPARIWALLALSALLIAINWCVYVWAVDHGRTLSASLGYYILPLFYMAAGALFFRERLRRADALAMALAACGVVLQGAAIGAFPWISLVLAVSFCGYGIVARPSLSRRRPACSSNACC